jgi:hypothetical protein
MPGPPLSRRTAVRGAGLLSAVAAAALGGCDLDLRSTPAPAAAPTPDADERLLLAARAELTGLIVRIRSARSGTRRAEQDAFLADLEQAHVAQLAALGGRSSTASATARPLRDGPRLVGRERLAAGRFATWAERAESGDLARVLAATSAGITTYLSGRGLR